MPIIPKDLIPPWYLFNSRGFDSLIEKPLEVLFSSSRHPLLLGVLFLSSRCPTLEVLFSCSRQASAWLTSFLLQSTFRAPLYLHSLEGRKRPSPLKIWYQSIVISGVFGIVDSALKHGLRSWVEPLTVSSEVE